MINWGEKYYDHFERYLGHVVEKEVFRKSDDKPSIQILTYENVFKGCKVFSSIGLSNYSCEIGCAAEVVLVADDGFNDCPDLLANILFYITNEKMQIKSGLSVKGIQRIRRSFSEKFDKHGLYFTAPFGFPDEFNVISGVDESDSDGSVFLAFFISEDEAGYVKELGAGKFEDLLEMCDADVFAVDRKSVV